MHITYIHHTYYTYVYEMPQQLGKPFFPHVVVNGKLMTCLISVEISLDQADIFISQRSLFSRSFIFECLNISSRQSSLTPVMFVCTLVLSLKSSDKYQLLFLYCVVSIWVKTETNALTKCHYILKIFSPARSKNNQEILRQFSKVKKL